MDAAEVRRAAVDGPKWDLVELPAMLARERPAAPEKEAPQRDAATYVPEGGGPAWAPYTGSLAEIVSPDGVHEALRVPGSRISTGRVPEALPVERVELHSEEAKGWIRVFLGRGGSHVLAWAPPVPEAADLPSGDYRCRLFPDRWEVARGGRVLYTFNRFAGAPEAVGRAVAVTRGEVPCRVVREGRAANSFPVRPQPEALRRSAELTQFAWRLLERHMGAPRITDREVTIRDVETFVASRPDARATIDRVTQAWGEMSRTRRPTLERFEPLAELLVEQYRFGNETVLRNELAVRDGYEGLGLYHRRTGLRFYDENGIPTLDVGGVVRRDVFYAVRPRPTSQFAPARRDWATMKLSQMVNTAGVDVEAVALAEGLWENGDLLVDTMRRRSKGLQPLLDELGEQAMGVAFFVAIAGVLVFLQRVGPPQSRLVASLLYAALIWTGRYYQIRFVYDLRQTLYGIGHHLYRVKRMPDGTLDTLSREHLDKAADLAGPLLESITAQVILTGMIKIGTAAKDLLPPAGGAADALFVPALAGAGAMAPARAGAAARPGAAAVTGGKGPEAGPLVVMAVAGARTGSGGTPGGGAPPRARGRRAAPEFVETNVRLNKLTAGTGRIWRIWGHRRPDGALEVEITGELGPPIPREQAPNFNKRLPRGSEIELPNVGRLDDYEIAHLWGPGFGDEAWDGMMYAPRGMNQEWQNRGIEGSLRELAARASREGATIRLTARAEGHGFDVGRGHDLLKQASYRFEVTLADGRTLRIGEIDITVPAPASGESYKIEGTPGSGAEWAWPVF